MEPLGQGGGTGAADATLEQAANNRPAARGGSADRGWSRNRPLGPVRFSLDATAGGIGDHPGRAPLTGGRSIAPDSTVSNSGSLPKRTGELIAGEPRPSCSRVHALTRPDVAVVMAKYQTLPQSILCDPVPETVNSFAPGTGAMAPNRSETDLTGGSGGAVC